MCKKKKDMVTLSFDDERNKEKHDRYLEFEHTLRYCFYDVKDETERDDDFLLNDIKQAVIVYLMKDTCSETNNVFLSNVKEDFYKAIEQLVDKHSDLERKMKVIKLFMEDFYF